MPTAYTTLVLTNDTIGDPSPVVADLVDGTNYQLLDNSWAPAVSARRLSRMAGQSPYEEVVEEIQLVVRGGSGSVALNNLAKLSQILDLADRFRDGDLTSPVWLECQPQGSVLADPVRAVVLGRPPGSSILNLPPTFNDNLGIFEIAPVTLRFLRSGLWYGASDQTDLEGPVDNPTVETVEFGSAPVIAGPTQVVISGFDDDSEALTESYLFIASDNYFSPSSIQIIEGETGSPDAAGVTLTSTADSSNNARGGSVGRITSPSTTDYEGIGFLLSSAVVDKRAYILAAMRNNTSATWYVYAATNGGGGKEGAPTKVIKIDGTKTNDPQIVPLGICYNSENHAAIRLYVKCSTTSGSPQLDIDYIAIMGMDNQHNYVTHLIPGEGLTEITAFTISPEALTAVAPTVKATNTIIPAEYPVGYDGDIWIATNGEALAVAWFACRENYWRWSDSSNAVLAHYVRATRNLSFLTPQ